MNLSHLSPYSVGWIGRGSMQMTRTTAYTTSNHIIFYTSIKRDEMKPINITMAAVFSTPRQSPINCSQKLPSTTKTTTNNSNQESINLVVGREQIINFQFDKTSHLLIIAKHPSFDLQSTHEALLPSPPAGNSQRLTPPPTLRSPPKLSSRISRAIVRQRSYRNQNVQIQR